MQVCRPLRTERRKWCFTTTSLQNAPDGSGPASRRSGRKEGTLKITVVGLGRVGTTAASGLASAGHSVLGMDVDRERVEALRGGSSTFYEPGLAERMTLALERGALRVLHRDDVTEHLGEVAVVAVGTPQSGESVADLRQVREAVSWIRSMRSRNLVIAMKSTVPPGTGMDLMGDELLGTGIGYVANPEFLREGQAIYDWEYPDRIVIGAAPDDARSVETVKRMHTGIDAPFLVTDITSAEMIKYANNAFLATRISFINEIAAICDSFGASIDAVSQGLAMDPRTGSRVHAGVGYGGSCLPKDVRALDLMAHAGGVASEMLRAVSKVNRRQRFLPLRSLRERFNGSLADVRVGVLGLAFKPDTDDVRDAPSLDLIRGLIDEGAVVTAFDPQAGEPAESQLPPSVRLVDSVEKAAEGAQALCLVTEWDEIVRADWWAVARRMAPPRFVFDGRNALDPHEMRRLGLQYVGIGRNGIGGKRSAIVSQHSGNSAGGRNEP